MAKKLSKAEKAIKKLAAILRRKHVVQTTIEAKPNKIGIDLWRKLLDIITEATEPEEK